MILAGLGWHGPVWTVKATKLAPWRFMPAIDAKAPFEIGPAV